MNTIKTIIVLLLIGSVSVISAQVTLKGATEATPAAVNKSYTTLKGAFDAINANTSALATDVLELQISDNTTETASAALHAPLGISAVTGTAGTTTYKFPVITLTGGTNTAVGTFTINIYNGAIFSITNTGGAWTVAPTVTIEGAGGVSNLNVTEQATAFCTAPSTSGVLTFYVTNGGAGYSPRFSVDGGGGIGAAIGFVLNSAATTPTGTGPYTISPVAAIQTAATTPGIDQQGTGYASAPTVSQSGGTVAVAGTTSSYTLTASKANYTSLIIYPVVTGKTIEMTSTQTNPAITLFGSRNVTIDGRLRDVNGTLTGATSDLTIKHTNTGNNANAIHIDAGAKNINVKYCNLRAANINGNTRGIVSIGGLQNTSPVNSGVGGSDIVISDNVFTSSGVGSFITAFSSNPYDYANRNVTISNNKFENYLNASGTTYSGGIYLQGNASLTRPVNINFTISNNSFYQTATFTSTVAKSYIYIRVGDANRLGGYGHAIQNNYIGGSAAQSAGTLTKVGAFADVFTGISVYSGTGTDCSLDGNTIKGISWTNGSATGQTFKLIDVNGLGNYSVSNNTVGDNSTGSLVFDNTVATTSTGNVFGIYINNTGNILCQNNKIGSVKINHATTTNISNLAGIWKSATAGNCTIINNTIGNAGVANSILNNSGSTQWTYPVYSAGTSNVEINGNTIANISNNTTTGNIFGVFHESGSNQFRANANLIHSLNVTSTSTAAKIYGINCASGTNLITNNIVKLNGDNAATIYGLNEESSAVSTAFYHNTVYISGAPASESLNSACVNSNGSANTRSIQNNIFVNARTNNGATGNHFALLMPAVTGTVVVDANNYRAIGANGSFVGSYGGNNVSSGSVIVTGQDVNSLNVDPGFALAGGDLAENYMTSITLTGVGSGVTSDYSGAVRSSIQMGAWNKSVTTADNNSVENDGIVVMHKKNQLIVNCKDELSCDASLSVYNVMGRRLASAQMLSVTTVLDIALHLGIYFVVIKNGDKKITKKNVFN